MQDEAQLRNQTQRSRANGETMGLPSILGLESSVTRVLPNSVRPDRLVDASSSGNSLGTGEVRRAETVTLRVAATVTQTLPNGNLVVMGRQQVRVNNELRDLTVAGIMRPQHTSEPAAVPPSAPPSASDSSSDSLTIPEQG